MGLNGKSKFSSHVGWIITSLMFIAITINYIDREIWVMSEPAWAKAFGWYSGVGSLPVSALSKIGLILFLWSMAYAIFNFPGGWISDRLGIRKSMGTFFAIWSAFTAATAATFGFISMAIVRIIMGSGEGPVWPLNAKSAKTWSNAKQESTMYTLAGSGQAMGPIIAAIIGAYQIVYWGWQLTFIFWGVVGLVFAAVWYFYVRDTPQQHPGVSKSELENIENSRGKEVKTEEKLSTKETWMIALKLIFTTSAGIGELLIFISFGYILFTVLYWIPPYFYGSFLHSITKTGLYVGAVDGALLLGYLLSGPVNDGLSRRLGTVMGRRLGSLVPMTLMIIFVAASYYTGIAHNIVATVLLLAAGAGVMNITVGSWAVNAFTISPAQTSATVYGVYNGVLNIMGAFNSLIIVAIATAIGFTGAITSMVLFMVMFIAAYLIFIRQKTFDAAIAKGNALVAQAISSHKNSKGIGVTSTNTPNIRALGESD
ncbi:MAG: MFS transporter [Conexivisphaerales archaeon]